MEEWKEYKLGQVVTPVKDKIDTSALSVATYISTENMLPNKSGITVSSNIPPGNAIHFQVGDILISNIRPYFKKIWMANKSGGCSADVVCLRATNIIDPHYLYFLLSQNLFFDYVMLGAKGTKMPRGDRNQMMQWPVLLPPIQYQHKIASVLSSIDAKIDLNKRINDNLEQQAQALYKAWFVDFEPFKGDGFVDSELGMIPKGWSIGVYDDIISDTISGDWGKEKEEGNYTHRVACIRGCDFQDIKNGLRGKTPERFILEKNFQNKRFCDKDMLVEISGGTNTVSTGRVCPVSQQLIDKYNGDIVCTNFCKLVRPKKGYGAYLYYSWLNKYNNKVMFGYENGTSGIKNFRIKDFTSIEPVVLPPLEKISEFQSVIDTIQKRLQTYGTESQKLASLRDILLPRLMSGYLKINELSM